VIEVVDWTFPQIFLLVNNREKTYIKGGLVQNGSPQHRTNRKREGEEERCCQRSNERDEADHYMPTIEEQKGIPTAPSPLKLVKVAWRCDEKHGKTWIRTKWEC